MEWVQTVGQWLMGNLMTFVTTVGAMAAVVAAVASVQALHPRPKPIVENPHVSLAIHHANTRHNSGFFLAKNGGPKPYGITDIAVRCPTINLPDYNLVAVNHWPGAGVGRDGTQKLPLSVEGYASKQIYFHTEEVARKYEGKLPDSVTLEIRVACKPMIIVAALHREGDTHKYQ